MAERSPGRDMGDAWQDALTRVEQAMAKGGAKTERAARLAGEAGEALQAAFPLLQRMAEDVCPDCREVCCVSAMIDYTWRDLVLLKTLGLEDPPHSLREHPDQACRYLKAQGCSLERLRRPFLCNFWMCAAMSKCLAREPYDERRALRQCLALANRSLDTLGRLVVLDINGEHPVWGQVCRGVDSGEPVHAISSAWKRER